MRRAVRVLFFAVVGVACTGCAATSHPPRQSTPVVEPDPVVRPVATYSIIARDNQTGELGAAVQSHWFSVGSVVPWARQGVGVVATQSLVDVNYGPLGLELMASGSEPWLALQALKTRDKHPEVRQVSMIDAQGRMAIHTGEKCIAKADACGEVNLDTFTVCCQSNLMERDGVPKAMMEAFVRTPGVLSERMMAALEAAQAAGGDIRGMQSAAMVTVAGGPPTLEPWKEKVIDIRVEDDPNPLAELRRLLLVARGYAAMNEGDAAIERGDVDAALAAYATAEGLIADNVEPTFWTAVSLANAGRVDDALPRLARCYAESDNWRETLRRLVPAGLLTVDERTLNRMLNAR